MTRKSRGPNSNQLLASLPPEDGAHLASVSRIEHPARGRVLTGGSEPNDVWFPHTGAVKLTTTDESGRSVQTGMVGCEGCVGLEALFDTEPPLPDATVQIEGAMTVIPASDLRAALKVRPSIQVAVAEFLYDLSAESLQTIACNRLHSLEARCCRWLLTMRDKAGSDDLTVTQEGLATLLGSGRPRINALLAALERAGLLRRYRGRIHLLAVAGLERRACDCYREPSRR